MTKLTNEELQAIKERAEKATPGPWEYVGKSNNLIFTHNANYQYANVIAEEIGHGYDGDFIAHSHKDVPMLLSHITQLQAEIERLQTEVAVLERVVAKPKVVTVHVKKETEFSSWENFPY